MSLTLYAHPFSSYCQKVLTALYENGTPFTYRQLSIEDKSADEELAALWPLKRFPVLVDDGRTILESTIIIEYLCQYHPGPSILLPGDAAGALEARLMDRIFDNYVMTPMQKIVFDFIRPDDRRDPFGVAQAREMLDNIYRWLNDKLADRTWAAGDRFGLADCAASPALFYADWTHPIDSALTNLRAYRARLLARPSFARAVNEGRPFRAFFPLGAPDRD
jgi:glutathione S-transferase